MQPYRPAELVMLMVAALTKLALHNSRSAACGGHCLTEHAEGS